MNHDLNAWIEKLVLDTKGGLTWLASAKRFDRLKAYIFHLRDAHNRTYPAELGKGHTICAAGYVAVFSAPEVQMGSNSASVTDYRIGDRIVMRIVHVRDSAMARALFDVPRFELFSAAQQGEGSGEQGAETGVHLDPGERLAEGRSVAGQGKSDPRADTTIPIERERPTRPAHHDIVEGAVHEGLTVQMDRHFGKVVGDGVQDMSSSDEAAIKAARGCL